MRNRKLKVHFADKLAAHVAHEETAACGTNTKRRVITDDTALVTCRHCLTSRTFKNACGLQLHEYEDIHVVGPDEWCDTL